MHRHSNFSKNTVEEYFNNRAGTYEKHSTWVSDIATNSVPLKFLSRRKNLGNLLDAGAGTGFLSHLLTSEFPFNSIYLVDSSPDMLKKASEKMLNANVFNVSIESFCEETNEIFDTILLRQILHYVENVDVVIKLLNSILSDDGVIYVGQILVDDYACAEWHDELIRMISKNRRRTFIYGEYCKYFSENKFEIIENEITVFEDNICDFHKRSDNKALSFDFLMGRMKPLLTDEIASKMLVRVSNDNLYFYPKFCHLLLKKQI